MAATDLSTARLLSGLTTTEASDTDLQALIDLYGSPRLGAASALEIVAGRLESVTSDDITLDGSKRASLLITRADRLRQEQDDVDAAAEGGFFFDVAYPTSYKPELTERQS